MCEPLSSYCFLFPSFLLIPSGIEKVNFPLRPLWPITPGFGSKSMSSYPRWRAISSLREEKHENCIWALFSVGKRNSGMSLVVLLRTLILLLKKSSIYFLPTCGKRPDRPLRWKAKREHDLRLKHTSLSFAKCYPWTSHDKFQISNR